MKLSLNQKKRRSRDAGFGFAQQSNQGGGVIAEASGLAPAPTEPLKTMQGSPDQDDGLRVLSETVTGPTADQLSMGARGLLKN